MPANPTLYPITANAAYDFPFQPRQTVVVAVRGLVNGSYTVGYRSVDGGAIEPLVASSSTDTVHQLVCPGVVISITFSGVSTFTNLQVDVGVLNGAGIVGAGGGGGGGGDASAANQTSVQAVAGADATNANAVQGITGGKPIPVSGAVTATVQTPIVGGPPSAQFIAAAGTFQFAVQGGTVVALTLTNAPAVTATWVATVGFQWSPDGSAWNALSATPRSTLPGANAVQVTQTTTVGLWLATLPTNAQFVRYNVSAWTSGTIWGYVEPWQQTNGIIQLPWAPSVTSGQTISGWIDASGINSLLLRVSAITTTQLQFQGTNDPTGTDADPLLASAGASITTVPTVSLALAGTFRAVLTGHKWVRVQVTGTGTVCTIQGISATLGPIAAVSASGNSVAAVANIQQVGSVNLNVGAPNGSVGRSMGVILGNAVPNTDQNATAFAGSGRVNGTVVASTAGGGVSIASNLAITVTNLGTATALVPILSVSADASNYTDVWMGTPITTTTQVRVPAIPIEGRRRWSLISVGGTSTTVPATITTQELPAVHPLQRQFVDIYAATNPTASIIAGTSYSSTLVSTTLNSTSGVAVMEGCKIITMSGVFTGGTPVVAPVYTLQLADDPAGPWFSTSTTISPTAAGAFRATAVNVSARFARIIVSTASSGGTAYGVTYTAIYGIN